MDSQNYTFPSIYPLTPAPSNHISIYLPNFLLTHPCNLSPPTHMLTHSYNCLATHPTHLPILPLPKNYPFHKLNIWVLFQHQRQPSFEKGLSLISGCLVSSRPHSLSQMLIVCVWVESPGSNSASSMWQLCVPCVLSLLTTT